MTVRKRERERSVKPDSTEAAEFAALQILTNINDRIRNMARTKVIIAKKPIMSPEIEEEIEAALAQFTNNRKWLEWGMDTIRKQGNMVLLYGPPGTGKTKIAEYMSKRVGKGMTTLNMKDVGGKAPGHTERMVHETFTGARLEAGGPQTVFMDECEAVVWDRGRAGSDSMWMVGVIDEILMQTAKYPGLVVAATNREDIIDPALKSRCFAALQIGMPGYAERIRLWQQKIPIRCPLQLTASNCERLSEFELSGRAIENAIVHEASMAIKQNRLPEFTGLIKQCKKLIAAGQAN